MCKVKKTYPLWAFLLSFPLWTVSCVDNKYDLDKDIDMTVNCRWRTSYDSCR